MRERRKELVFAAIRLEQCCFEFFDGLYLSRRVGAPRDDRR